MTARGGAAAAAQRRPGYMILKHPNPEGAKQGLA